jgi:hypothetical protein
LYKENAFYFINFYLLKPIFYVISLLRSLLKGYLFELASDLEKLLFRDKLLIVSLNNVLLRVDNLLGLSSTPLFLLKSKISNDTLFFKKDVSKLILPEVSFNLD